MREPLQQMIRELITNDFPLNTSTALNHEYPLKEVVILEIIILITGIIAYKLLYRKEKK